jgi:hypothetical protein
LANEVIHLKLNVPSTVKRGLSDFYGISQSLEDQAKLLRNTGRGAATQASIALIREHQQGMHGSDIERVVSGQVDATLNLPPLPGGSGVRQRRIQEYPEGTVLDVVGSRYHPGPLGAPNGPTYVEIGQAIIRIVGARWSMPEHMISNAISGAGGARAAIVEMGTPFSRATKVRQKLYGRCFEKIIWKVLQYASFHGRINADFTALRQSLKLEAVPPEATQRNEAEQHLVLAGRHQAGIISKRRWRELIGEDDERNEEELDVERVQDTQDALQQQAAIANVQQGLGLNQPPETLKRQQQGAQGAGQGMGRQAAAGDGADSIKQDRTQMPRNPKQSIGQQTAAMRAGKDVNIR